MTMWRKGLREASAYERETLLRLERYVESLHLQEVARGLCDADPLGIVDCSNLRASASIRRWTRRRGKVFVEFSVRCTHPGAHGTYKYCFNRLLS